MLKGLPFMWKTLSSSGKAQGFYNLSEEQRGNVEDYGDCAFI